MPKFFITAAYPYPNGAIHIGHGRTYLIADVLARFHRHFGRRVLYPMGFHYTGTPILTIAEVIAAGDKTVIEEYMEIYDVPEEEIKKMGDPLYLARYFHLQSKRAMEAFGLSIDWTREFTTIDPEYQRFIQWQFEKLRKKGAGGEGPPPSGLVPPALRCPSAPTTPRTTRSRTSDSGRLYTSPTGRGLPSPRPPLGQRRCPASPTSG
jgi:leucyl-tRNA synthetase